MGELAAVSPDRLEHIFERIPLALAMRLRVASYDVRGLVLAAPFRPNRNHTGTAFGGAIECLATLAGWGLVWLHFGQRDANIVIHGEETRFSAPLTGELKATALAPSRESWQHFLQAIGRRGRGRIEVRVQVGDEQTPIGAEFRGAYAVSVGNRPLPRRRRSATAR